MIDTPTPAEDTRLADFKLLLPLHADARVLVIDCAEPVWIPHLCKEVAALDLVVPSDQAAFDHASALSARTTVRRVDAPDGEYDLILSDSPAAARHLGPGGVLCRFGHAASGPGVTSAIDIPAGMQHAGRWWALPGWPAFRALVRDDPVCWRAADAHLHLMSKHGGLANRLRQALPARRRAVTRPFIDLIRRADPSGRPALIDRIDAALCGQPAATGASHEPWLLSSGRLGPGNPVVAFRIGADGTPRRLIKVARYAGSRHLLDEAHKLEDIRTRLGPALAAPLILPTAVDTLDGRGAIAYDFVPTFPFFGLRWRLQARAAYCHAMTDWLTGVARQTMHPVEIADGASDHLEPLIRLCARGILPASMQEAAERALAQLHRCARLPKCLEHGDLGIYNTRLCSADGRHFRVLDWASSTPDGIALGDLAYLLASAHAPERLARRCLSRYLDTLRLPRSLATALWFSYLARRWAELDTVRAPVAGNPASGGGILIDVHSRIAASLAGLAQ